jgi:hypothetical protein
MTNNNFWKLIDWIDIFDDTAVYQNHSKTYLLIPYRIAPVCAHYVDD